MGGNANPMNNNPAGGAVPNGGMAQSSCGNEGMEILFKIYCFKALSGGSNNAIICAEMVWKMC